MAETWTEHQSCARCGTSLNGDFASNHLGVRFCHTCFDGTVRVKAEERNHEPGLEETCNHCGGSLINGYETNYMHVYFCTACFERTHTSDGRPRPDWAERAKLSVSQKRRRDSDESAGDLDWPEDEEEGAVYLHDVFLATTILALVMYAFSRFGAELLALSGY